MRVIRRLAFLTLFLLLLPTFASADERGSRGILPRLEATWIWQVLTRPWILIGKTPTVISKGGGTMDPNGVPLPSDDATTSPEGEGGGTMDPNG